MLLVAGACSAAEGSTSDGAGDAMPQTVEVTAVDYAFSGLPESVAAGTEFTLANESDVEVHELVAVRLPDDDDRSVDDLVADPEQLVALFPAVSTVLIAEPGGTGIAVEGDGTLTEPGRYALICAIPTGADPAEYLAAAAEAEGGPPDVAGGPPHFAAGMYAEVTVTE